MRGPISMVFRAALPKALSIASVLALAVIFSACDDEIKLERRTVTYPNGKSVREDWTFTRKPNGDSVEHGVHKKFFWSGAASESVVWKMGKRDGSAQAWYENGALKWQKNYSDGKKEGTWHLFYKDGKPWMVAHYENDAMNGTVQVWDKMATDEPKTAEYGNGACKSGDCSLLDAPVIPPEAPPANKLEMSRDWEIVKEYLD